jgi:phosphoenolpyruvate carboxykinase (GTP)
MQMLDRDTIFTNVGVSPAGQPWWEGIDGDKPAGLVDWQGRAHDPATTGPAAHPNARFTVSARRCASFSPQGEAPQGVPISAIVFGGRRSSVAPLVFEALDWTHGVFAGAAMASETTAAATGKVGQVRRDPMAMKPFCGYNFGDYFAHWLSFGERSDKLPRIFHVNWFRKDAEGRFMWPGFGDNMRVLEWIIARCEGRGDAVKTPIGYVPEGTAIRLDGLDLERRTLHALLAIDPATWREEIAEIEAYFDTFGARVPSALREQARRIRAALEGQLAA